MIKIINIVGLLIVFVSLVALYFHYGLILPICLMLISIGIRMKDLNMSDLRNKKKMKATLEFQLPKEQEDYDLVNQARNLYCVIYELEDYLRNLVKYQDQETININDLRQKIIDLKLEQGIKEYS